MSKLVHSVYVLSLPAGPIWALHGFYLVSMGLLLLWYLRFKCSTGAASARRTYARAMAYHSASSGMRDRLAPRQTQRILAAPVAISQSFGGGEGPDERPSWRSP